MVSHSGSHTSFTIDSGDLSVEVRLSIHAFFVSLMLYLE